MSKHTVLFHPGAISIEAPEGSSLLEVARSVGFTLQSECGGLGTCGRCKAKLLAGEVFSTGEPDLTEAERAQGFILACLARIVENLEVEIPPTSEFCFSGLAPSSALTPGEHPRAELQVRNVRLDPLVQSLKIEVPAATLQHNASDLDRLCATLEKNGAPPPFSADVALLRKMSSVLRAAGGNVQVLLSPGPTSTTILDLDTTLKISGYGLALDIGTTTIFARLIDLGTGEVAAEASEYNRQIPCGGDIIHRIIYAGKSGGLAELQKLVLLNCSNLLTDLLAQVQCDSSCVVAALVAGNTTMEHLLLGLDPRTIREEPYVPTVTNFPVLKASDVGLDIFTKAPVFFSPAVASYVGGDITAGVLAADIHRSDKLTLYIDLGTNGEIVLGNRDWLTACACSAGPAFEGSGVKCGMRAVNGAIDQVSLDPHSGELSFRVIGGSTPRGICGSGMIDLLAKLRAGGRIDARGKLKLEVDPKRIRATGRKAEILLINKAETSGSGDIVVTETDLDNLIRTKGAIFAGMQTLLKGVGLKANEIERVVIAGGFGRYLDIENAIRIGMLPDLPRERFEYIGNGSLRGAGLALLSRQLWEELHQIARKITYFELSSWQGYMDEFMAALFLPHTDSSLFPSIISAAIE